MALKGTKNKDQIAYDKYFKKTGIQITEEPLKGLSPEIDKISEKYYTLVQNAPSKSLPDLEKLVKEYPEHPVFKNYLYICYQTTDQPLKAQQLLDITIQEHPDYIFGISNKILNAPEDKIAELGHLLGENRHIRDFIRDRTTHYTEFLSYQQAAIHYDIATKNENSALERLNDLIEIRTPKHILNELAQKIAIFRLKSFGERAKKSKEGRIEVNSKSKVSYPFTDQVPTFQHPEINIFYKKAVNQLSEKERVKIMALPRISLIADLELVLQDMIQRWDYFQSIDFTDPTHEFGLHALFFLGALEAEESLPKVLDLLRMGDDFAEYWFADLSLEFFAPLYSLGKNSFDQLLAYCKEEDLFWISRSVPTKVVAQVALHQPDRRTEVIEWFKDIYQYLLANPNNERLIDSEFINASIAHLIDIRATELIPTIKIFFEKKWASNMYNGTLEQVLKEIQEAPHPYYLQPLPENIHEYYTKEYYSRRAASPLLDEGEKHRENQLFPTKADELVADQFLEMLSKVSSSSNNKNAYDDEFREGYYEPQETVVRTAPKVGRNDPCPCGSGKKYKKCCLRK